MARKAVERLDADAPPAELAPSSPAPAPTAPANKDRIEAMARLAVDGPPSHTVETPPPAPAEPPPPAPSSAARARPERPPAPELGKFSRGRRRRYHARRRHWRSYLLHPQRVYEGLLEADQLDPEATGRFHVLFTTQLAADGVTRVPRKHPWHPTDQHAIRRVIVWGFLRDIAKAYFWHRRARRRRRGGDMSTLAELALADAPLGYSTRGIDQRYLARLCAAGDGEPIDRSTVREIILDLKSVGLLGAHQPPPTARLAPYERSGKYAFSQYWFRMVGFARKPALRGPLDAITDWAERVAAWWAELARGPEPA